MNDAFKSARQSLGLGYAIAKAENPNEPFISPEGFSQYYRDCSVGVSLRMAWLKVSTNKKLRRSVNNWHGQDPNDT